MVNLLKSNFKFQFAQVSPRSWLRACGPLWISTSTGMVRIAIFPPERQMSCSFFHFLSRLPFLTGSWSASSNLFKLETYSRSSAGVVVWIGGIHKASSPMSWLTLPQCWVLHGLRSPVYLEASCLAKQLSTWALPFMWRHSVSTFLSFFSSSCRYSLPFVEKFWTRLCIWCH